MKQENNFYNFSNKSIFVDLFEKKNFYFFEGRTVY